MTLETPAPRPVREGLFVDGEDPRLLGSRCNVCGRFGFPRVSICPYCSAEGPEEVELSASGRLWAWTAVSSPPPGYRGEVPFGFGVVELPEGLRVLTRLTESDPAALRGDLEMRLVIVPLHADGDGGQVLTYAFSPTGTAGSPTGTAFSPTGTAGSSNGTEGAP